jgi:hypothetical protein
MPKRLIPLIVIAFEMEGKQDMQRAKKIDGVIRLLLQQVVLFVIMTGVF